MKKKVPTETYISIRVPVALRDKIKVLAKANNRSMSSQVRVLLEKEMK